MSACSSQLSPSLLGAAAAEVDSASTAHLTTQRQPRSASVGKLHGSARITKSSRSSRGAASSVSQPKEHSSSRAASTPASPQSPALPAESVASQGHRPSSTPLSSASTGQSRASSGWNISNKPRWQQSTAASSRHQHTGTSHPGPKQSFLTRLQAQAGQAAPDKQQQHDAKAAEMKAKLQEWRQQQKQQKQQQQQQRLAQNKAPNDVPGRLVMPVKKTLLQQPRLSGAKGNPVPALADPGGPPSRQVSVIKHSKPSSHGSHTDQNTPANLAQSAAATLTSRSSSRTRPAAASHRNQTISPVGMASCHAPTHAAAVLPQQRAPASEQALEGSPLVLAASGSASTVAGNRPELGMTDLQAQDPVRQPFRVIHADSSASTATHLSKTADPAPGGAPQHAAQQPLPVQAGMPTQALPSQHTRAQQHAEVSQHIQAQQHAEVAQQHAEVSQHIQAQQHAEVAQHTQAQRHAEVAQRSDGSSGTNPCSSSGSFDRLGMSQDSCQATAMSQPTGRDTSSGQRSDNAVHSAGISMALPNGTSHDASHGVRDGSPTGSRATAASTSEGRAGPMGDAPGRDSGFSNKPSRSRAGVGAAGWQKKSKGPSVEEANLLLQCERWRHLQWRFLNCRLEETMATAKPKAEQGLAAAALHVADLRKEVNQKQAELRAAERERQVAAALAGQLPRLQRWQSMQAEQSANTSAVQSALRHALQYVPLVNGATVAGSSQDVDLPAVAGQLTELRDALEASQQHVHSLMGSAADSTTPQCCDGSVTDAPVIQSTGSMGTTAKSATELAETSQELNHYLGQNKLLLEQYSHELLHVQSLTAQLVQMSNMQHVPE